MDISDDGTRLIIGSPYEDEQRGVVYLYELVDAEWTLFRKIENVGYSDSEPGDLRGMGVAISGDGQTIAFSAPGNDISMNEYHDRECKVLSCPFPDFPIVDQGSVYYGEWAAYGNVKEVYNAYLPLGSQVKLNGDGSVLVFEKVEDDSSTHGRASIYSKVLTYYDEEELITELPSPIFDTSADGNMVAVVENHQASYSNLKVFKEDGTLGVSYSECFSQFYSGINMNHVGISESGSRLILVTDTRELLLYELEITDDERGNEYVTYNKTYTSDLNDYAVVNASISDDGTRILIADADQKVRILTESDSGWVVQDEIESPNLDLGDCFGCVLAKPNDGDVFVIGAPGEDSNSRDDLFDNGVTNNGAVYLF
jgi:hypothetical protein